MRPSLPTPRRGVLCLALLWTAGMGVIWWLIPVGPRDSWQPSADEHLCGFLSDGRTGVTVSRAALTGFKGNADAPPVRLRDLHTGAVRAKYFEPGDVFSKLTLIEGQDLLKAEQHAGRTDDGGHLLRLRLVDAWTGKEVVTFSARQPDGAPKDVGWIQAADGRVTAFAVQGKGLQQRDREFVYAGGPGGRWNKIRKRMPAEGPVVELHDVPSGRLLYTLPYCCGPMCFSPDGTRLAAVELSFIVAFDVPTGREVARLLSDLSHGMPNNWVGVGPKEFSPDGTLLLDGANNV